MRDCDAIFERAGLLTALKQPDARSLHAGNNKRRASIINKGGER